MFFFYFNGKWFNRILIMNIFSYQHESKWFVAFIRFYFIFVKKQTKYEHLYSDAFVSHTHQRDLFIICQNGGEVRWSDWRVRCWRNDVRRTARGTLQPLRPPSSPERHKLLGRQAKGQFIFLHLFLVYNPLYPSCMVDIIFSSSFLGDMGDHSKSK